MEIFIPDRTVGTSKHGPCAVKMETRRSTSNEAMVLKGFPHQKPGTPKPKIAIFQPTEGFVIS